MNDFGLNLADKLSDNFSFPQVFGVCATIAYGVPVPQGPQPNSQTLVRGVFISSDALQELQDKAQNHPNTNGIDSNGSLKLSTTKSDLSQPIAGSQTSIVGNPQISAVVPPVTNSQQLIVDSPPQLVSNAQTVLSNQQTSFGIPNTQNQYLVSQPSNQASQIYVSQPSGQSVLVGQLGQPSSNLPVFISQSPSGQQMMVNQPNQPIYIRQPSNQPIYISNPPNQPILVNQQDPNQILITTSNQPTLVYQNGQPAVINNPTGNQVTLVAQSPNTAQNQGTIYAVVPVNNGQSVPNVNSNSYIVPSNQVYTISTGN